MLYRKLSRRRSATTSFAPGGLFITLPMWIGKFSTTILGISLASVLLFCGCQWGVNQMRAPCKLSLAGCYVDAVVQVMRTGSFGWYLCFARSEDVKKVSQGAALLLQQQLHSGYGFGVSSQVFDLWVL